MTRGENFKAAPGDGEGQGVRVIRRFGNVDGFRLRGLRDDASALNERELVVVRDDVPEFHALVHACSDDSSAVGPTLRTAELCAKPNCPAAAGRRQRSPSDGHFLASQTLIVAAADDEKRTLGDRS